jgi:hypothetical protein
LKTKGLVKSWGTHDFIYRPGEKDRGLRSWPQIVALNRGAYPKKLGRWRGFLYQSAVGSFAIQG